MSDSCSKPEMGHDLFRWAMRPENIGRVPSDEQLAAHLRDCSVCRDLVAGWKKKAVAGLLLADANRVISGNLRPDEKVDLRSTSRGTAMFKYLADEPDRGLLIVLDGSGRLESLAANVKRIEFDRLFQQ